MSGTAKQRPEPAKPEMAVIRPKRLYKGARIALVATGSPFEREDFDAGVQVLRSLGFEVKYHPLLFEQKGYLAGSDDHRAHLLTEAILDDEVQAVFCVRGGYGTLRILSRIDASLFKLHPKIIVGYSDVTALLNFVFEASGLIAFHGPMLIGFSSLPDDSLRHFLNLLTREAPLVIRPSRREIIQKGRVRGRLIGGNLTTLAHLIGTPYEPSWEGRILFVEESGERLYRIDRLFTQLKYAGRLSRLAGLVLGHFTEGVEEEEVWEFAYQNLRDIDIPIVAGFPFGHGRENMAVPVGATFKLDGHEGILELAEPCLR